MNRTVTSRKFLLLYVFSVISFVTNQEFVNVAIGKSYSQISFHRSDRRLSSSAANGNTSGEYTDGNCIHTRITPDSFPVPSDTYHWWEVDLGRTYPIHNITLWGREGYLGRIYPCNVTVDDQLCATVTSSDRKKSVTCSSVMYGRKVRITLTTKGDKSSSLNLCECQIYVPSGVSQCPAGRWGGQCDRDCSDNCGKGPGKNFCYQNTGFCYDDCVPGYFGPDCTQQCDSHCTDSGCDRNSGYCLDVSLTTDPTTDQAMSSTPQTTQGVPLTTDPMTDPVMSSTSQLSQDPSRVQTTVRMTLKYVLVTVCTTMHENQVETTVHITIIKQNEEWPGLCSDSHCSNAHVTATCDGALSTSITTVVNIEQVPATLRSNLSQEVESADDVLRKAAVEDGAFDLQDINAIVDKTQVLVKLLQTCTPGFVFKGTNCVAQKEASTESSVPTGLLIAGVAAAFVVVLALLVLVFCIYRRLGKADADGRSLRGRRAGEDGHDYSGLVFGGRPGHSGQHGHQAVQEMGHLALGTDNHSFDQQNEEADSEYDEIGEEDPEIIRHMAGTSLPGVNPEKHNALSSVSPVNSEALKNLHQGEMKPPLTNAEDNESGYLTLWSPKKGQKTTTLTISHPSNTAMETDSRTISHPAVYVKKVRETGSRTIPHPALYVKSSDGDSWCHACFFHKYLYDLNNLMPCLEPDHCFLRGGCRDVKSGFGGPPLMGIEGQLPVVNEFEHLSMGI